MGVRQNEGPSERSTRAGFRVLVATDGSPGARAALATAVLFPWPAGARARAVVARGGWLSAPVAVQWPAAVWTALGANLERIRREARRVLARRWPDADVGVVDDSPVAAILAEARRLRAGTIVVGSRGHRAIGRLLVGSVSRGVVRRADCPVLVVRRARPIRHLLLGLDGSANARRALGLVARLNPPRGGRVTLLRVLDPIRTPSMALMPAGVRATLTREAERASAEQRRVAQREVERAARRLDAAGWRVRARVEVGVPLPSLLGAIAAVKADTLVLGARGVGGVERLLLGSVAEGALNHATVPVLLVK